MPAPGAPLDLAAARAIIASASRPLAAESIALTSAAGRFLARAYAARADLVPYARSAMDGYALCAMDTFRAAASPLLMPVCGSAYAGDARTTLEPGHVFAIATGGALPVGANAVVPWEAVEVRGEAIVLRAPLRCGEHVFPPADDARTGDVIARPGDAITPGRAALLAAIGVARVDVHRRPRVTIISTGDEIVDPAAEPAVGQIRDSNAAMLATHVRRDGGTVVAFVRVRDAEAPVIAELRDALTSSDLVITTGGASAGERDYVKRAATSIGAAFAFTSLALRPAKPTGFARRGGSLLAMLPGNPAAAFVAYTALFGPVVRALGGDPQPALSSVRARLDGSLRAKPGRHYYAFARVHHDRDGFVARVLANQCSSLVRTSAEANAFVVVPPGDDRYDDGAIIDAEVFEWPSVTFTAS
jgi:molybdopterin molybdotransferase